MTTWPFSILLRLLVIQIIFLSTVYSYPSPSFMIVPSEDKPVAVHKRAFDRLDGADFGFWSKRAILKRAFDRLDGTDFGFRKKRAFDRIARTDFGFRRKRSFDRISPNSFGLNKRSIDEPREELIAELAESILALKRIREEEMTVREPLVVLETI